MQSAARKNRARRERNGAGRSTLTSSMEYRRLLPELLPEQGGWSEEEYLVLTQQTSRLVEFTDGLIEVLPMPTDPHQSILGFLFVSLFGYLEPAGGKVQPSGLRIRIRPGKFREPDVSALLSAKDKRRQRRFWLGADLVMEVVSEDKPERDLLDKRFDYAEGKIKEYWIVNPLNETVTVLALRRGKYEEHGVFGRGQKAVSLIVKGFKADVSQVFDAGR